MLESLFYSALLSVVDYCCIIDVFAIFYSSKCFYTNNDLRRILLRRLLTSGGKYIKIPGKQGDFQARRKLKLDLDDPTIWKQHAPHIIHLLPSPHQGNIGEAVLLFNFEQRSDSIEYILFGHYTFLDEKDKNLVIELKQASKEVTPKYGKAALLKFPRECLLAYFTDQMEMNFEARYSHFGAFKLQEAQLESPIAQASLSQLRKLYHLQREAFSVQLSNEVIRHFRSLENSHQQKEEDYFNEEVCMNDDDSSDEDEDEDEEEDY